MSTAQTVPATSPADPITSEATTRLLRTAVEIRGAAAVEEARARLGELDAAADRVAPWLAHDLKDRRDWKGKFTELRKILATRHMAAVHVAAMEAIAAGKEPSLSPPADLERQIAIEVLQAFARRQRYPGLAFVIAHATGALRDTQGELVENISNATASHVDGYRRHGENLPFGLFFDRLSPVVDRQVEAEGVVAALDPLLAGLAADIPARIAAALDAGGGADAVVEALKEATALKSGPRPPDPQVVQMEAQAQALSDQLGHLASSGAKGKVAQDLTAQRDALTQQIDARKAELLAGLAANARDLVTKAAAGDLRAWRALCDSAAAVPQAYASGFLAALTAAVAGALEARDPEAWAVALELCLLEEPATRRRLAAVGLARAPSPAAAR